VLRSILGSLQRIAYNGDPLQMLVEETTYQPFISLTHMLGLDDSTPSLKGVPNFASALAIELRRGSEGDSRDYVRIKFKNGTADGDFQVVHAFDHKGDVPLSEFIYRTQNYQIKNNREWASACGRSSITAQISEASTASVQATCGGVLALVLLFGMLLFARSRKVRQAGRVRLAGEDSIEVKA
jgi:lysosomal acid phosphatase